MVSGRVVLFESVSNAGIESFLARSISVVVSIFFVSLLSQATNKVDASKISANQRSGCSVLQNCFIDLVLIVL